MEQQTVVAAFDRPEAAEDARDALLESGFTRAQVRVSSEDAVASEPRSGGKSSSEQSLGQKIAHFFGLDDDEATYSYSETMRRGGSVVVVDAEDDEEAARATDVLMRFEPIDMDQRVSEWEATGWQRPLEQQGSRTGEQATIPVVEEQLQVGTRVVEGGGVRVFSRTRQIPVEERVELREERATITRRPTDRPVTDADRPFEDQSLEVRETREEPVVGKETRRREEQVRDSVRKTEVEIQQAAEQPGQEPSRRQRD